MHSTARWALVAAASFCAVAQAAEDAGPAPGTLTPTTVEEFVAYNEYVVDTYVTATQRAEIGELVAAAWDTGNARDQALVLESVAGKADLANHSEADKKNLRGSVEDEHLKAMRKRTRESAVARWVVAFADARKPLVPGSPPLTRQSADAAAELVAFVLTVADGGIAIAADKPFRDAFAKGLAADYKGYSDEQKAALADLPRDWAVLRMGFSTFSEDKGKRLKKEWGTAILPLVSAPAAAKLSGDAKPVRALAKALCTQLAGWLLSPG